MTRHRHHHDRQGRLDRQDRQDRHQRPDHRSRLSSARIPRAGVDPLRGADDALALIEATMTLPLAAETIVVCLDQQRRGSRLLVVESSDGRELPWLLGRICDLRLEPADLALVVASVRPDGAMVAADADRWLAASEMLEGRGIELVEWFVVGHGGAACPRALVGGAERW